MKTSPGPKPSSPRLKTLLTRLQKTRILVIGDLMVDHYLWGEVSRISPEAPVPVVKMTRESRMLGGAANVAHNLQVLGVKATLLGLVGQDADGRSFQELMRAARLSTGGILRSARHLTPRKTRVIAHNQQVVRVDRENHQSLSPSLKKNLLNKIRLLLPRHQAVILEDYGKGLLDQDVVDVVISESRKLGIYAAVDPKVEHHLRFQGASLATPNLYEARYLANWIRPGTAFELSKGDGLRKILGLDHLLITLGEQGMMLFGGDTGPLHIPTQSREVYDVSGAGDTVISVFTAVIAAGGTPSEAAHLANAAAGVVVGKLGTATVSPAEIREVL